MEFNAIQNNEDEDFKAGKEQLKKSIDFPLFFI